MKTHLNNILNSDTKPFFQLRDLISGEFIVIAVLVALFLFLLTSF